MYGKVWRSGSPYITSKGRARIAVAKFATAVSKFLSDADLSNIFQSACMNAAPKMQEKTKPLIGE
jgi:hypothetical protein